jgi:hypothetical protein
MARAKIIIILFLVSAVWLGVLLKLGLGHMILTPAEGHLSRTFDGWAKYPASRHLFLIEKDPNDFAQGKVYISGTYPFIFTNFLLLAPFHFLLGLPYDVAHNFLPCIYIFFLTVLLTLITRRQLLAISRKRQFLLWLLVLISIGISITDPLPWTSSFNANRDNGHILTAGMFCYLSTFVFYNKIPRRPLLIVGIFFSFWSPTVIPAWILAGLFFHRRLALERRWILQVAVVCSLTALNIAVPRVVTRWAGGTPGGSGILFRSGLDGSQEYVTSIPQAVLTPIDPRHWPTISYFFLALVLSVIFHYLFKQRSHYRPLQQALFLLIPYSTFAIFLPQLTSVHPYITDLFIFIPATFLMSFWFLQKPFWQYLNGSMYVGWFLFASLVLMSNLLAFAQMPRFAPVERGLPIVTIIFLASAGLVYFGLRLARRFHINTEGKRTSA